MGTQSSKRLALVTRLHKKATRALILRTLIILWFNTRLSPQAPLPVKVFAKVKPEPDDVTRICARPPPIASCEMLSRICSRLIVGIVDTLLVLFMMRGRCLCNVMLGFRNDEVISKLVNWFYTHPLVLLNVVSVSFKGFRT